MPSFRKGNLLKSDCDYLCFTSNSVINKEGELVMGKGIAKAFKDAMPNLPYFFGQLIKNKSSYHYKKIDNIIALQTKIDWRDDSELDFVIKTIQILKEHAIEELNKTFAVPLLGTLNGKLNQQIIREAMSQLPDNVYIYTLDSITYAGIGSRETPTGILKKMTLIAEKLSSVGYNLNSGGANGADYGFEKGAKYKNIFLPGRSTKEYSHRLRDDINTDNDIYYDSIPEEIKKKTQETVDIYHPYPLYLKPFTRKLMARNALIILGKDLVTPVDFVICWTADGCESKSSRTQTTGGTGQAISIASSYNIPIINMARVDWEDKFFRITKLTI